MSTVKLCPAERSRERDDLDAARACCAKRRGCGGRRRSGRVDVVDESDAVRRRRDGPERAAHAAPLGGRRAALSAAAHAYEERLTRELPRERELARETLGRA